MNATLMRSIVEHAAFLALSGDDIVNPDAAVAQLEQLAEGLKELSSEDRLQFVRFIQALSEQERKAEKSRERIAFLETLPENLGIK
jgi:hypothetical protein